VAIGSEAAKAILKMKVGFRTVVADWPVANPAERAADEPVDEDDYAAVFDEHVERVSELVRSLHGTITPQAGVRRHA
jgi:hypothetical protein